MLTRVFLIEILLHRQSTQKQCFFNRFYYSQIKRTFSRHIYCYPIHFQTFFTIMMSLLYKLFIQSHFESIQSTQSKYYEIKTAQSFMNMKTCNLFIKRFTAFDLNIFVPCVFNKRNHPETQDKYFIFSFLIIGRRVLF